MREDVVDEINDVQFFMKGRSRDGNGDHGSREQIVLLRVLTVMNYPVLAGLMNRNCIVRY